MYTLILYVTGYGALHEVLHMTQHVSHNIYYTSQACGDQPLKKENN